MQSKKYEALVVDYDGTLGNKNCLVDTETSDAINKFVSLGGKFAICTGRMTHSIAAAMKKAGITGVTAAYDGGEITDLNGNVVFRKAINTFNSKQIFEYAEERNIYCQGYSDNIIVKKITEYTKTYSVVSSAGIIESGINLSSYYEKNKLETCKILFRDDKEKLDLYYKDMHERFSSVAEIVKSSDDMVDFTTIGIDKGTGLKRLADLWNIDVSQIIAIGDERNDVKMIKTAGLGVAVGNANEALLAVADEITVPNDENPVKRILEKYFI